MRVLKRFQDLPISEVSEEILESLSLRPRLIVTAPPGAGKSTLLPLAILENKPEGKILMLEPRRVAARQVANRMASMLGEKTGQTVGYRVRFDTCVSSSTKIEVVTEGVFERMLIEDPTLEGVATVIFDEYHERSLSSDLCLAIVRDIQKLIRPDLRILVMSATIDADSMSRSFEAPHICGLGKCHEVTIVNGNDIDIKDVSLEMARGIRKALDNHDGNILAFLPGQAEILKCQELLENNVTNVDILPLYGMLSPEQQQRAIAPSQTGRRRIVLATPIAETSLTIEGVTVVIDSGLYRTTEYEPSTALSRLVTRRISIDMADQRAGRAGRLMPGVCYRLWTKATESRMKESREPEILTADLSSLLLTLSDYGENEILSLNWMTPPPAGHIENARNVLKLLSAVDIQGRLTDKGRKIAKLPCHPRIAAMLTESGPIAGLACDVAAILEEKDPCNDETDVDISTRVEMLRQWRKGRRGADMRKIENISSQYRRIIKAATDNSLFDSEDIGRLIASAYPERIAIHEGMGKYKLAAGGERKMLDERDDLNRHEFLAIASMGNRIFLAAPLSREFVTSKGEWSQTAVWNSREARAIVQEELRFGSFTLASRPVAGDKKSLIASAIASAAPKEGLSMFDFNDDVCDLQFRIEVVSTWHPELCLPDVTTDNILRTAGEWLPLYIGKAESAQELRKIDMKNVILGNLSYDQQQALERIAPTHLKLPNGRNVRIRYRKGAEAPVVSARLQDCFGMMETPRVDEGKRPVLMELLSPGFKPVQLTQDMAGFWKTTYFDVRKELFRRYPKHNWPTKI